MRLGLSAVVLVTLGFYGAPSYADEGDVSSTVIYGADFIASYPNAVTVVDIIQRIPGGSDILSSGSSDARGFSGNRDSVLINGKRVSGKSNDGSDALSRITVEQVERIELIRGGSPDVKVSSQEAILNIVLLDGAGKNAGAWQADARIEKGGHARFGGLVSYGGSLGQLEYFASIERFARRFDGNQIDRTFDGEGNPVSQLNETERNAREEYNFSTNLSYNFSNGDVLRVNGKLGLSKTKIGQPGVLFTANEDESLSRTGASFRSFRFDGEPNELEFSSDYETNLGDAWRLKLLALHSRRDTTFLQAEDLSFDGENARDDFQFISTNLAKESIGRASLTWVPNAAHSLELGSEAALNTLRPGLRFLERVGDELVERPIAGANIRIKEERNESFAIHSWKLTNALSLESSIFTEYSRISQTGEGVDQSRAFFYVKPSADLRYNLSNRQQFQLSLRRQVSQLDFGDFASSVSNDDEVIGANADLVPQKAWEIETSYEYRLDNDGGSLKVSFLWEEFEDFITRIETAPGLSGVGNAGSARRFGPEIDGTLRLGFLGLPDALIEATVILSRSRYTNPFTNRRNRFNGERSNFIDINYRHDVKQWGFSYGAQYVRGGRFFFRDIDEVIEFKGGQHDISAFAEKALWRSITLRVDAANLTDPDYGRTRRLFDDGVNSGILSRSIAREFHRGRQYRVLLKGVF